MNKPDILLKNVDFIIGMFCLLRDYELPALTRECREKEYLCIEIKTERGDIQMNATALRLIIHEIE